MSHDKLLHTQSTIMAPTAPRAPIMSAEQAPPRLDAAPLLRVWTEAEDEAADRLDDVVVTTTGTTVPAGEELLLKEQNIISMRMTLTDGTREDHPRTCWSRPRSRPRH